MQKFRFFLISETTIVKISELESPNIFSRKSFVIEVCFWFCIIAYALLKKNLVISYDNLLLSVLSYLCLFATVLNI